MISTPFPLVIQQRRKIRVAFSIEARAHNNCIGAPDPAATTIHQGRHRGPFPLHTVYSKENYHNNRNTDLWLVRANKDTCRGAKCV